MLGHGRDFLVYFKMETDMDKQKLINRMRELVDLLNKAAYAYEQQNTEIMSNYTYDKLYDELLELEKQTGVILAGSVTQKVGYEVMSVLPKVTHTSRMLSLDKTKEISKLKSFLGDKEGLLSWKLDGLTIVCTYEEGRLRQAVTRGNGEIGEDVTNNAKTFKNLPLNINYKGRLVIRGEALISYTDFNRINENLKADEEKYKNPRNLCSGSVRQLNPEITAKRNVQLYIFSLVEGQEGFLNKSDELDWLKSEGFEVVEYKRVTAKTIEEEVLNFQEAITLNDFASDGLVLTYNDIHYSKSLGTTSKFPKDAIAFKWKDEVAQTKIVDIEWNTSRTGLINPVAIFEPVDIEGTTVERASVHNLSILEELKLGIGDTINVYKANMIIPQILDNLSKTGPAAIPDKCPVCLAPTVIKQEKSSKTLYCTNPNCQAQKLRAFVHYVSRDAMNIEGLSEATIAKFLEKGFLTDFVSLYYLSQFEMEIKKLEGFGEKSYLNLIEAIEKSRHTMLANFIYALGIAQVGLSTARLLCKYFDYDLNKIVQADISTLTQVEGIGEIIAKQIKTYFTDQQNIFLIMALEKELTFKDQILSVDEESPIKDKVFVITGDTQYFKNRKELQAKIEELGGKVTGSVSKNTDYLINNNIDSASSKNKKAKELNIPIITEETFMQMINEKE